MEDGGGQMLPLRPEFPGHFGHRPNYRHRRIIDHALALIKILMDFVVTGARYCFFFAGFAVDCCTFFLCIARSQ